MSSFINTASLPTDSTVKASSWSFVLIIALAVHAAAFIVYELKSTDKQGAKYEGVQGVEIGFKEITLPKRQHPSPPVTEKPKEKRVEKKQVNKQVINKKNKSEKKQEVKKHADITPLPQLLTSNNIIAKETTNTTTKEHDGTTKEALATQSNKITREDSKELTNTRHQSKNSLGGGDPKAKVSYRQLLLQQLERYKRYPNSAMRRKQEGVINLEFIIDQDGNILSYKLLNASRYKSLNKAVEKMIKKANPLPKIPSSINTGASEYRFIAPIKFELNE